MAISSPSITTQDVLVNNTIDDQGEESYDQFYFFKLPHHPFHF